MEIINSLIFQMLSYLIEKYKMENIALSQKEKEALTKFKYWTREKLSNENAERNCKDCGLSIEIESVSGCLDHPVL